MRGALPKGCDTLSSAARGLFAVTTPNSLTVCCIGGSTVLRRGSVLQRTQAHAAMHSRLTVALLLMREAGGTSLCRQRRL